MSDPTAPVDQNVLSYLVPRLATHPENIATEALGFILHRSRCARRAVVELAQSAGLGFSGDLSFRTQVAKENGARPDLVGESGDGVVRILIEAKFWAGLTDKQPVEYLDSLKSPDSILVFVAPEQRADVLWSELMRRCLNAGRVVTGNERPIAGVRYTRVGDRCLALTSWRDLLRVIASAVAAAGEGVAVSEDIRQLQGLCERMDSDAFLPLQSEEITGTAGRRVLQFIAIASDLVDRLVSEDIASVNRLRASAGASGWIGRYLRLRGHGARLSFSSWWWAHHGRTPIWLTISGPDWKPSAAVYDALRREGLPVFEAHDGAKVPIDLPTGVDRDAVMESAYAQIERIAALLPGIPTAASDPLPEKNDLHDEDESVEEALAGVVAR